MRIDHSSKQRLAAYDYETSYRQAGESKSGYAHRPAPNFSENYRIGDEAKI